MTERRAKSRIKVILPALCWSKTRPDFYAVTEDVARDGIRFKSALSPYVGESLTCSIRHAGSLETVVLRVDKERFAVRVVRADFPLTRVVQSLVALAEAQNRAAPVVRTHPRVVPDAKDVFVVTADGVRTAGRLVNVSASGAALFLDEPPEIGALITIGRTPAKVARRFDNGIGAAFLSPLPGGSVGAGMIL